MENSENKAASDGTLNEKLNELRDGIDPKKVNEVKHNCCKCTCCAGRLQHLSDVVANARADLILNIEKDIKWYGDHKKSRARWARWNRFFLILSSGIAVVLSLLASAKLDQFFVHPVCASIAFTVVGTLYLFERYYGNAEAWMRFEVARQDLDALRSKFFLDWIRIGEEAADCEISKKRLDELIRVTKEKHQVIQDETNKWIDTFKSGMQSSTPKGTNGADSNSG